LLLKILLIGLLTGTLIGAVGVGGILLTPLLIFALGTDLHIAQATSSFSFLFTGLMGTFIYARRKSIAWAQVLWISLGVIPATIAGARVNTTASAAILTLILAALILYSGANALVKCKTASMDPGSRTLNVGTRSSEIVVTGAQPSGARTSMPEFTIKLKKATLVFIGLGVGFGSALTGTGGPVLLVPLLLTLGYLPLSAVGVSQAVQLPIAVFATLGFLLYGEIDFSLGIALGVVQSLGVIIGGLVAHKLPQEKLRLVVAITLMGVGVLMIWRVVY
jgi:uncharacterized membrane protein YfcA